MRNIKLYLGILFCLYFGIISAEPYERIILKNGSELDGYISVQRPGKDIIFIAEKAMIYLSSDQIQLIVDGEKPVELLSKEWQEWIKNNPVGVVSESRGKYLVLSDILLLDPEVAEADSVAYAPEEQRVNLDVTPRNVQVLERGEVVKYLDLSEQSYHLAWEDIQVIKRSKRAKVDLSGLIDVVELKSGNKYQGQIIEQAPGKQIRLLKEDGIVEVIDPRQIAVQKKIKLNPEQELLLQTPFMDVVCTSEGEEIKGIIIEQNYGSETVPSYMLIQSEYGNIERRKNNIVTEIRKEKNPHYNPLKDIIIKDNEVWVNRQKTGIARIEEHESILVVDTASYTTTLYADSMNGEIVVELQNTPANRGLILLKLIQINVSKRGVCSVFTYEDLVTRGVIPSEISVSINGTLKLIYSVVAKGDYILYNPKEKSSIFLNIR